jgi:hypothetical protein
MSFDIWHFSYASFPYGVSLILRATLRKGRNTFVALFRYFPERKMSRNKLLLIHKLDVSIPAGAGNFSLHHRVQTGSGAHLASYLMGTSGSFFLAVRRPGFEADRLPSSSAEVKNAWNCTSTIRYAFMASCSVKAQGQLYLYLFSIYIQHRFSP